MQVKIDDVEMPTHLSRKEASGSLDITYTGDRDKLYTLVIYDVDAPYPEDPSSSPYLHYAVVNIPGDEIKDGDTIMPYTPPHPPKDSKEHRYIISLFIQKSRIVPIDIKARIRFDVNSFVARHNLKLVEEFSFSVG